MVLWAALVVVMVLHTRDFHYFFSWDTLGYYAWVPAAFLHGDFLMQDFAWLDAIRLKYELSSTLYQVSDLEGGHRLVKYPIGLGVTWVPWFLIGHCAALLFGYDTDGFSLPYQWAVRTGVLCYLLLGLLALRKVLLHRFSERTTVITILLLVLGTNQLDHVISGLGMVHITTFGLYAGILWYTIRWRGSRGWKDAFILALLMGMQTLTRASEALCVLLPLLWWIGDGGWRTGTVRLVLQWAMIAGVMFLIGLPQFALWKAVTGHWVVDTYNNAGEGFDLLTPHTVDFLFSYRKGWFVYTPLMLLTVGSLFLLLRRTWKEAFLPIVVFFVLSLYLTSSWTCWWYASSYGQRAMVGIYAVLAIPLAALVHHVLAGHGRGSRLLGGALVVCTLLNLFQYWQYTQRILDKSRMTGAAYWAIFGRTEPVVGIQNLLLLDRGAAEETGRPEAGRYRTEVLGPERAEHPWSHRLLPTDSIGGPPIAYHLDVDAPFTPALTLPYGSLTTQDHVWVEARWHIWSPVAEVKCSFVTTMQHQGRSYGYRAQDPLPGSLVAGGWSTHTVWYLTPDIRQPQDPVTQYFWLRDTVSVLVNGPEIILHHRIPYHEQ